MNYAATVIVVVAVIVVIVSDMTAWHTTHRYSLTWGKFIKLCTERCLSFVESTVSLNQYHPRSTVTPIIKINPLKQPILHCNPNPQPPPTPSPQSPLTSIHTYIHTLHYTLPPPPPLCISTLGTPLQWTYVENCSTFTLIKQGQSSHTHSTDVNTLLNTVLSHHAKNTCQ